MSGQVADFDSTLIESVDEAIRSLFSQQVVDALHSNLKDRRTIGWNEIPTHLPTLSLVLEKYFGLSAPTVEKAIAAQTLFKVQPRFSKSRRLRAYRLC